jgi:deoxyribodipyrimidine photolyase
LQSAGFSFGGRKIELTDLLNQNSNNFRFRFVEAIMLSHKSVLYWLREPSLDPEQLSLQLSFEECNGFIPVFCFDSRDERFFSCKETYRNYLNKTIKEVADLRTKLQQKGSNLLIVNGNYEVLIPSLSRILQVNEVVTSANLVPGNANLDELADFRKRKTEEIEYYLRMHSISMKIEKESSNKSSFSEIFYFPPFPEINPGMLPVMLTETNAELN